MSDMLPAIRAWDHTDHHGDRLAVSRPPAGGVTIHGRSRRRGDKTDVWLDAAAAADLAAVLLERTSQPTPTDTEETGESRGR